MRALVNTGPGRLELLDWPTPEPGPGQVRIRTAACGICATDLIMIAGWERTGFPAIPGHEWSGVVHAVGPGVDAALVGRRCVAENVLSDGGEVGFEHAGGYGEYFVTEAANVQPLPADFPAETAALIEPLAVSVRAFRRMRVEDLSAALIFGDGPIGLIMLMLLRRAGVKDIVLVGSRPGRLALARELGANRTLSYREVQGSLAVASRAARSPAGQPGSLPGVTRPFGGPTADAGFMNIVEASGAGSACAAALELAPRGAHILLIGDYEHARAAFPWMRMIHGELELIGSNASAGAWPEAVWLATSGELPLGRLVTHRIPVTEHARGLALMRSKAPDVVKVVMEW